MTGLCFEGSVWCNVDITLRHIDAIYKQETQALGVTVVGWHILRLLYEQDGQMPSQLARGVGRAVTSFTPILDQLEQSELIERCLHPSDRRAVRIYLTIQGKALQEQVQASAERIENKLRHLFSDIEWQSYQRVIATFQTMDPQ